MRRALILADPLVGIDQVAVPNLSFRLLDLLKEPQELLVPTARFVLVEHFVGGHNVYPRN